jgi:hypothetical protein
LLSFSVGFESWLCHGHARVGVARHPLGINKFFIFYVLLYIIAQLNAAKAMHEVFETYCSKGSLMGFRNALISFDANTDHDFGYIVKKDDDTVHYVIVSNPENFDDTIRKHAKAVSVLPENGRIYVCTSKFSKYETDFVSKLLKLNVAFVLVSPQQLIRMLLD